MTKNPLLNLAGLRFGAETSTGSMFCCGMFSYGDQLTVVGTMEGWVFNSGHKIISDEYSSQNKVNSEA